MQGYAAKTVFEALQAQACHENMVKVGSYILGEQKKTLKMDFGRLLLVVVFFVNLPTL